MKQPYLLITLAFCTPVLAQEEGAPIEPLARPATRSATPLITAPEKLLTPQFVRYSSIIIHGTLNFKQAGDATIGEMPYGEYERLKGVGDLITPGFGLGDLANWKSGEKVLIFGRYDHSQKRAIVVGKVAPTEANIERVKALVTASPEFEISVATEKIEHELGEPIKVRWEFKNVSPEARSLFTGEFSTQISVLKGDKGASSSTSDPLERRRPRFTEVAPGESWVLERTLTEKLDVGSYRLWWRYEPSGALKRSGTIPQNLALVRAQDRIPVEILPATGAQLARLDEDINSRFWDVQLQAALLMLQSDDPSQWKKLERFVTHPYDKLRSVAATALSKDNIFSPTLKSLLYTGTYLDDRYFQHSLGDFVLAEVARTAVEDEARRRGFKGRIENPEQPLNIYL